MNKSAKKFLIYAIILIVIQILSGYGSYLSGNGFGFSPILIILSIIDLIIFFKELKKDKKD